MNVEIRARMVTSTTGCGPESFAIRRAVVRRTSSGRTCGGASSSAVGLSPIPAAGKKGQGIPPPRREESSLQPRGRHGRTFAHALARERAASRQRLRY
jgi:hypothetical protein